MGVVAEIGPGGAAAFDGTPLAAGDRVIPAPNRACGRCHMCARGFPYYLCRNIENYGNSMTARIAPHLFGGWSEYLYLKPGTATFRVPDELPDDVAVLTEIFAVTHSLERAAAIRRPAGFRPGDAVAIIGAGPLGLAHAVKASLMGAGHVLVLDPSAKRRELAARVADAVALAPGDDANARCASAATPRARTWSSPRRGSPAHSHRRPRSCATVERSSRSARLSTWATKRSTRR